MEVKKITRPLINGLEEAITLLSELNSDIDLLNSSQKDSAFIQEVKNITISCIRNCANCTRTLRKRKITNQDINVIKISLESIFSDIKQLSSKESLILSKIKLSKRNYISRTYNEIFNSLSISYCMALSICSEESKDKSENPVANFFGSLLYAISSDY